MAFYITKYGLFLGLAAFGLTLAQHLRATNQISIELFSLVLALGFAALGIWVGIGVVRRSNQLPTTPVPPILGSPNLTRREQEVLDLLAQGYSNKQIARQLKISPNTIKTHMANLFSKLEVSNRVGAIQTGRGWRLIT